MRRLLLVALIALAAAGPAAARSTSGTPNPDPAPPSGSSATPGPDPAPQALPKSAGEPTSGQTPVSHNPTVSPVRVTPRYVPPVARTTTPAEPTAPAHHAAAAPVSPPHTAAAPSASVRPVRHKAAAVHRRHAPAHRRHRTARTSHSTPRTRTPASAPVTRTAPPHVTVSAGPAHHDGVLLLVGAGVLLVLVAVSGGLLRVLWRMLGRPYRERSA